MNQLNLIYQCILRAWGVETKPDYRLVIAIDDAEYPIRLDEKDTYLPTDDALSTDASNRVYFHPACESIVSRETDIFKIIRRLVGLHLLIAFKKCPEVLFDIAQRKSKKSLNNERNNILDPLRNTDASIRKEVSKLMSVMECEYSAGDTIDKRFINFDVIKGAKSKLHRGEKAYYRVKPSFPFYIELARKVARNEDFPDDKVIDIAGERVKLRSARIMAHLFQSIVPSIDDPSIYEVEQYTAEAARFLAFCNCYVQVAEDMNHIQSLFRADFDKVGVYNLDTSFASELDLIPECYRQVPPLAYNSTSSNSEETVSVEASNRSMMEGFSSLSGSVNNTLPVAGVSYDPAMATAVDGFKAKVIAELQPGETWVGVSRDPITQHYRHQIQTNSGLMTKVYSMYGNLLSKEFSSPMMGVPGMGAANPLQQMMMMQQMMGAAQAQAQYNQLAGAMSQPSGGGAITPVSASSSRPVTY